MTRAAAVAAVAAAIVLAGCGGSDSTTDATTTTTAPAAHETIDKLPKLPSSWHKFINERDGLALGLPRGWKADHAPGGGVLVRSYDHLVALSIAVDRRPAALDEPLDDFASATAAQLRGFRGALDTKAVRRYPHRYYGAEVRARGTAKGGVRQRVFVIVLRRDHVAVVTAVIAANVKHAADDSLHFAKRVVATLRTRPPRSPSAGQ